MTVRNIYVFDDTYVQSTTVVERMQIAPIQSDQDTAARTRCGTDDYMAPEVFGNENEEQVYDARKADVWGCGVT